MILRLTVAFSGNPRVEPLKDSGVRPHGIDLDSLTIEPDALFPQPARARGAQWPAYRRIELSETRSAASPCIPWLALSQWPNPAKPWYRRPKVEIEMPHE